jgi:hypothetical protein
MPLITRLSNSSYMVLTTNHGITLLSFSNSSIDFISDFCVTPIVDENDNFNFIFCI